MSAVPLQDQTLVGFRSGHAAMARDLAKASRDTAAALDGNDPELAMEAAQQMSSFGSRESDLVDAINDYCAGEGSASPGPSN